MKAILASRVNGEILWGEKSLTLNKPSSKQCLIRVLASSVNPVDYKVVSKLPEGQSSNVLGWDAVGEVVEIGEDVKRDFINKRVWYLGSLTEQGCQSEYQLVDFELLAYAPESITATDAASLPLTGVTALELLIDKLGYKPYKCLENKSRPMLVINGAGGVGSILLQLCNLWDIPVTATASRQESQQWCLEHGANFVVKHQDIFSYEANSFASIVCAHDTDTYFNEMTRLIRPFGQIIALSGTQNMQPVQMLMDKSASFGFEFVFTRCKGDSSDKAKHKDYLDMLTQLVNKKDIKPTSTTYLRGLSPENLAKAHHELRVQKTIGKIVIEHIC
jgi:NADPH:quinone reductase